MDRSRTKRPASAELKRRGAAGLQWICAAGLWVGGSIPAVPAPQAQAPESPAPVAADQAPPREQGVRPLGAATDEPALEAMIRQRLDQFTGAAFLPRDGGRMTGPLHLPPDGLAVGVGQIIMRNGDVGLGTMVPRAKLDVGGRIRIAGGEPGEGKVLVSDADGLARWAAPEALGAAAGGPEPHRIREGSVFGPRSEQPLILQVAGRRAFRIEPEAVSPNLIGGSDGNTAKPRAFGVTIAGGGAADQPHRVDADFGSVGGGAGNVIEGMFGTVGGGWGNAARGPRSTIAGGRENRADGPASIVGGGFTNRADGGYAIVGGGYANQAGGYVATVAGGWANLAAGPVSSIGGGQDNAARGAGSTVSGGWGNRAEGKGAAVPGGKGNVAAGDFSAAGGLRAIARHPGSFVWSDSEDADFESTGADQFLIKARGNVGIDTASPAEKLTVLGNVAPAESGRHDLGTPDLRWETAYLGSTVDATNSLRVVLDGQTRLAISQNGDIYVTGTLHVDRLIEDRPAPTHLLYQTDQLRERIQELETENRRLVQRMSSLEARLDTALPKTNQPPSTP